MEDDKIVFDFDNPGVEESKPWLTSGGEMQPLEQVEEAGQRMVQENSVLADGEMGSKSEHSVEIMNEQQDAKQEEIVLSDETVVENQTEENQELPWN